MPSVQRGQAHKTPAGTWGVRFYDETGARRRQGGFATRSDALDFLDRKVDEVARLRRGDVVAVRRQHMPTLAELVSEYLAQHSAEANTLRTLEERLRYATATFGDLRIDRLTDSELGAWRKRFSRAIGLGDHEGAAASAPLCRSGETRGRECCQRRPESRAEAEGGSHLCLA
jgi:hypothetical protein